jgi:tetratricopeptide (TPR) repeat protein
LKAYSAGFKVLNSSGNVAAVPLFKHAIEIDPKFAMAHAVLGRLYGDFGESVLSAESTSKAYQLRDRASDRERFLITASYDLQATGNLEKAQQTCELWGQTYPREVGPHGFLSGIIYPVSGQYEKAVEESKKAIQLDPNFTFGYFNLAASYINLDRLGEAENTLRRASERKLELPDLLLGRYDIAFLKGDQAGMDRELALAQGKPEAEDWISQRRAFALAYSGHLQQPRRASRRAADWAQEASQRERAALYEAGEAVWEAFSGNAAAAKQIATSALELGTRGSGLMPAMVWACCYSPRLICCWRSVTCLCCATRLH